MKKNRALSAYKGVFFLVTFVIQKVCCLACIVVAFAQQTNPVIDNRASADKALLDILHSMALSQKRISALSEAIGNLEKERKILMAALIDVAKAEHAYERDIQENDSKLAILMEKQRSIEIALERHRSAFSVVLSALERVGFNWLLSIFLQPDNALQSVRNAILLCSLASEMRERTNVLVSDLRNLERIISSMREENVRLIKEINSQQADKKRLSLLLMEKSTLQKESEERLSTEKVNAQALVEKARSLQAILADFLHQPELQKNIEEENTLSLMQIQTDFANLRGLLPRPVYGKQIRTFGRSFHGELIETEPGAVVISPAEGIVRYAGIFRSYGQLLIIDVGQNYHIVLAGFSRINVAQNQMLLQGEPIGIMGTQLISSTAVFDMSRNFPTLYIEIRKDGKSVNPAFWWAGRSKKNGNTS